MTKRKLILVVCTVLVAGLLYGSWYLLRTKRYQNKVAAITTVPTKFTETGLSHDINGTFTGEFDADLVGAKVEVDIVNGEIQVIRLLAHKNDRGSAAEVIVEEMNREKTTEVANVTEATNSSKVIKKAIDEALALAKGQ